MHALSSNRFSGAGAQLDLMFAGSMFEHSCAPNIFAGNFPGEATQARQTYRCLRQIKEGEALSIDYLLLPEGYYPTCLRAEILGRWGFQCKCPRCTRLPELTRSFICPQCAAPELCPSEPSPDAKLTCLKCGADADAAYAARCFEQEKRLLGEELPAEAPLGDAPEGPIVGDVSDDCIGCFHHVNFAAAWHGMLAGPRAAGDIGMFKSYLMLLIECISRFYGDPEHPQLLDLYHTMATCEQANVERQQHYLMLERAVIMRFWPDKAERQDAEIMRICQGNRNPSMDIPTLDSMD